MEELPENLLLIPPITIFKLILIFPVLKTIVLVLAGMLLLFFIFKKWYPRLFPKILLPVKVIFVAIVFFDLIYFSKDVLAFRLQDISNYKIASVPKELENKRVIIYIFRL